MKMTLSGSFDAAFPSSIPASIFPGYFLFFVVVAVVLQGENKFHSKANVTPTCMSSLITNSNFSNNL